MPKKINRKSLNVSGNIKENFSFWFGKSTEIYDAKAIGNPNQNEWDWYKENMVAGPKSEDDDTDYNVLLGNYPEGLPRRFSGPVKLSMDSNVTHKNLNTLVIGNNGAGKTFKYLEPNLAQMNSSFIVCDPSGEIYAKLGKMLHDNGYKLYVFNTKDPKRSNCYNPFDYIFTSDNKVDLTKVTVLINIIATPCLSRQRDLFWEKSVKAWLTFAVLYIAEFLPENQRNLSQLMKLAQLDRMNEDSDSSKTQLGYMIDQAKAKNPAARCFEFYDIYSIAPARTREAILMSVGIELSMLALDEIRNLTSTDYNIKGECHYDQDGQLIEDNRKYVKTDSNIDFAAFKDPKTKVALFLITRTADSPYEMLNNLLCSQLIHELYCMAEESKEKKLPVHVRFFLDEFVNAGILIRPELLATCRGYNISFTIMIHCLSQLDKIYGKNIDVILSNIDTFIFMGSMDIETCGYISEMIGNTITKEPVRGKQKHGLVFKKDSAENLLNLMTYPLCSIAELTSLPLDYCIVMIRGLNPMKLRKLSFADHPNFTKTGFYDKANMYLDEQLPVCPDAVQKESENNKNDSDGIKPLKNPNIVHGTINKDPAINTEVIISGYCTDDCCKEPTKVCIGYGSRAPYGEAYRRYGKHVNMYTCENKGCIYHPGHDIILSELAGFLKLKNPDKASKKDVLHAVIEIIEKEEENK